MKRIKPSKGNKTFCMAPWTHTYLSPQTERRMCCASREPAQSFKQYIDTGNDAKEYKPLTLKEHWNSKHMRSVRLRMLAGEQLPECEVCDFKLLNTDVYRSYWNKLFANRIDEAFEKTDETGATTMPTISFDYRFNNLCNFKCRMCGEQLSSTWEAEKYKHNMWTKESQPFMQPKVKEKMKKFQVQVVEPEFKDAISKGIVEEIYWVGGEPLMYEMHWWALEEMINNKSAKNCYLRYNSNLSKIHHKGKHLYDYLPQFKDWLMCASIDGTGEIVEFIRKNIVWKEWLNNFKEGLKLPGGKDKMLFDLTITGPGMFSIKDLFDLSLELDVKIETKIMFAFHPDIVFSPFAWPRHILDKKIDELLFYIEPKATYKQNTLVSTLKEMKNRPTFAEQWPDTYLDEFKKGKHYQNQLDKIRNEKITIGDIYKHNTELYEWWSN